MKVIINYKFDYKFNQLNYIAYGSKFDSGISLEDAKEYLRLSSSDIQEISTSNELNPIANAILEHLTKNLQNLYLTSLDTGTSEVSFTSFIPPIDDIAMHMNLYLKPMTPQFFVKKLLSFHYAEFNSSFGIFSVIKLHLGHITSKEAQYNMLINKELITVHLWEYLKIAFNECSRSEIICLFETLLYSLYKPLIIEEYQLYKHNRNLCLTNKSAQNKLKDLRECIYWIQDVIWDSLLRLFDLNNLQAVIKIINLSNFCYKSRMNIYCFPLFHSDNIFIRECVKSNQGLTLRLIFHKLTSKEKLWLSIDLQSSKVPHFITFLFILKLIKESLPFMKVKPLFHHQLLKNYLIEKKYNDKPSIKMMITRIDCMLQLVNKQLHMPFFENEYKHINIKKVYSTAEFILNVYKDVLQNKLSNISNVQHETDKSKEVTSLDL